ncbi:MAG: ACP S-malonyltransferase [Anaerolineae bacterium]
MDWTKTVFTFPGQGSQVVGMGKDLAEKYPIARQTYDQADEILGFKLSALCFDGPEADLNRTLNTQPAIYTTSVAFLRVLQALVPQRAFAAAGHSLGEFTALYAADAITFEDGLRLVRERGRLMNEAGEQNPGAMAAVLGLESDKGREICAQATTEIGRPVIVANDNCPGQLVISGDMEAIERALALASEAGAKRTMKLAVSIAAHSPLMAPAADAFRVALNTAAMKDPTIPIYGNVNAQPLTTVESLRTELDFQLTGSVCWTDSIRNMIAAGAAYFLEIGPGDVLTGLLKRIDRSVSGTAINNVESLEKFIAAN